MNIFKGVKYITCGVRAEIPPALQLFLWNLIETLPEPKDYLQVFQLSSFEGKQKIIHSQEQPEYKKEHLLALENPITVKIYCIDDETHCTMLLASEY